MLTPRFFGGEVRAKWGRVTTRSKLELGIEGMRPAATLVVTEDSVCSQKIVVEEITLGCGN